MGVSGGSDSVALMYLLAGWASDHGLPAPLVVCVDHGLRPEAKAEAKRVMAWARAAGLKGQVLAHEGSAPSRDIEAAARAIRYGLIGAFARKKKLAAVYVAHTEDDQAETFLLRLARGSGVDGLSGMRPLAPFPDPAYSDLVVARPLLNVSRQTLRAYLQGLEQDFIDDPMNADPRFTRVQLRQAMPELSKLGLTPARLALTCGHLARARGALELAAEAVMARASHPLGSAMLLDSEALGCAPPELALRTLASVLMAVSGNPYRPRFERLAALYSAISRGDIAGGRTLHGCRIGPAPKRFQHFGAATLVVEPEKDRSSRNPTKP
ncbi:hypothetical protein GCM10008941_02310 [Rhizomicrobium palustre]